MLNTVFNDYQLSSIQSLSLIIPEANIFARTKLSSYIYMIRIYEDDKCSLIIKCRDGSMKSCMLNIERQGDNTMILGSDEILYTENGLKIFKADSFEILIFVPAN